MRPRLAAVGVPVFGVFGLGVSIRNGNNGLCVDIAFSDVLNFFLRLIVSKCVELHYASA